MPPNPKGISVRHHKTIVTLAFNRAARVLPLFEQKYPRDKRPRQAIAAGRAWLKGPLPVGAVRTAAFAAHAAARSAKNTAAKAAARAAGQAASTVHVIGHARHVVVYTNKATQLAKDEK
jgi:hypothetical protein